MQTQNGFKLKLQLIEGKADYLKSVGWSPEPPRQAPPPTAPPPTNTTDMTAVTVRQSQPTTSMIDKNGDIWSCIVCGKIASDPKTKVVIFYIILQSQNYVCRLTSSGTLKLISRTFHGHATSVVK